MSNVKEKNEVYKCSICGNIVEVVEAGGGELVCCGKPMEKQEENTVDAAKEKHIPVIEKTKDGYLIKIGEIDHPMTKEHYIQWIEILVDGKSYKQFLNPDEKPEAMFCVKGEKITARAYCNIHGIWKK